MPDTIDINITPVVETVSLTIQPNLTTINVNTITGGGGGGAVTSVNTLVGDVVLNQDNILDGTTNKQYSLTEKNKLAGIAAGAEVNVNADWNATSGDAQILNKPSITTPTLQEVTDADNETTNAITLTSDTVPLNLGYNGYDVLTFTDGGVDVSLGFSGLGFTDISGNYTSLATGGAEFLNNNKQTNYNAEGVIYNDVITNKGLDIKYPTSIVGTDKVQTFQDADGVIALLSDITGGGGVPYTGATQNLDLGTHTLLAKDLVINHPSGSGVAASITKGGSGEALTVVKSSGSGNAASITGGVTLLDELHLTTDLADAYIASASTWNAKQNALGFTPYRFNRTTEIVHTGTTSETILQSILIPANTFTNGDFIMFSALVSKLANIGSTTHYLKINTTNSLVGASLLAINGFNTVNFFMKFKREFVVNGGNIYGFTNQLASTTNDQSIQATTQTINTVAYNLSNDLYFLVTCQLSNATDTITYRGINLYKQ